MLSSIELNFPPSNCNHEIKRCLLLEKKAMRNLEGALKGIDITLPTKVHIVKAMIFAGVVMNVRVGL